MDNFWFVVKTFLATLAILLVMQIKWGEHTIDDIVYSQLRGASILTPVNEAASGGILWIKNTMQSLGGTLQNSSQAVEANSGGRLPELKRYNESSEKEEAKPRRSRFQPWINSEE